MMLKYLRIRIKARRPARDDAQIVFSQAILSALRPIFRPAGAESDGCRIHGARTRNDGVGLRSQLQQKRLVSLAPEWLEMTIRRRELPVSRARYVDVHERQSLCPPSCHRAIA